VHRLNRIAADRDPTQCRGEQDREDRHAHQQKEQRQDDDQQDGHDALFIMGGIVSRDSATE
jgi:hypothetical protein